MHKPMSTAISPNSIQKHNWLSRSHGCKMHDTVVLISHVDALVVDKSNFQRPKPMPKKYFD